MPSVNPILYKNSIPTTLTLDFIEVLNVFFTQRKFGAKNFLNTSSLRKNKMWEFGSATIVHSKSGNVGVPTNYVLYALLSV
ncbi:hypothetical protein LEP1GSC005_2221 [Leptospira santarosai str. ST188]|uniref:hypothetical protein n=1 Tax=Leptospira santarosai TaxID=28183 RepID=UPI000297E3E0|nr:hypothetical protein [Leptospira santarosai]EMF91876.1 hypothetical protein LEP1GSC005_2221 [Leptospira santarosai str. ST188]EMJ46300.1 hypothetical protein LEP1GSC169_2275 [Leptospira santarosai str. HAI1349]EMO71577.1 hypothetical protein LEP1GSC130_1810 [Leptospira santarosai str. 200403458]EMO99383.1 hypothetical protein LEP1GSC120_2352 [Leptospira santarosai str. 200702252]EMP80684.1 hypothetical protein LEP1GSC162_3715 [Leptospira santarosai str. CBC1531]